MHVRMRRCVQWPMYGDTCSGWTMVALTHVSHVAVVFLLFVLLLFAGCIVASVGWFLPPAARNSWGYAQWLVRAFTPLCREVS